MLLMRTEQKPIAGHLKLGHYEHLQTFKCHLPTTSTKPGFRNSWEHGAGSSSCHKVPAVSGLFSWTAGQIVGVDGIHDGMV